MAKVVPFRMSDQLLRKRIADIASDSSRVVVTRHAKRRMRERKVLLSQVLDVLTGGAVVEPAHQDARGNWCCTLQKLTAGDQIKVPVAVEEGADGEAVIVITVMN